MSILTEMGQKAKEASFVLAQLSTIEKNQVLRESAKAVLVAEDRILKANKKDVQQALASGIRGAFIDRLTLDKDRIRSMVAGLNQVATLEDPVGEVLSMKTMENGLLIGQKRVPMGVIGIIFEARPNVTADAFGLCLKAGSSVILRGGKEAFSTNQEVVTIFRETLKQLELPVDIVQMVPDTSREVAYEMMKMKQYLDVLIPRGGAGLIQSVVENSTVPVIETGVGNCHIFVDETADLNKAVEIVLNAKTQRPGVCNACESLLVHEKIMDTFMPMVGKALKEKNVEIRGDDKTCSLLENATIAQVSDWAEEFNDYIIAVRQVKNIEEAISHIRMYTTGHSEAILTENYTNAQTFLNQVDAAAVYVNASTRFTDGSEFGFGAEIGISTQKLHARGPMGLKELTTTKYIIYGTGQIRQ